MPSTISNSNTCLTQESSLNQENTSLRFSYVLGWDTGSNISKSFNVPKGSKVSKGSREPIQFALEQAMDPAISVILVLLATSPALPLSTLWQLHAGGVRVVHVLAIHKDTFQLTPQLESEIQARIKRIDQFKLKESLQPKVLPDESLTKQAASLIATTPQLTAEQRRALLADFYQNDTTLDDL